MNESDSSNDNRIKARLQTVIRLLTLLATAETPLSTKEAWPSSDIAVMEELETGGYILADDIVRNDGGKIIRIANMQITARGKTYLNKLQKQEVTAAAGSFKSPRFSYFKWIAGIIVVIIAGLILWLVIHH
jgi:hypothetical protein